MRLSIIQEIMGFKSALILEQQNIPKNSLKHEIIAYKIRNMMLSMQGIMSRDSRGSMARKYGMSWMSIFIMCSWNQKFPDDVTNLSAEGATFLLFRKKKYMEGGNTMITISENSWIK